MNRAKQLESNCGSCNKPIYQHSGVDAQDCLIDYNSKLKKLQEKQNEIESRLKQLENLFLEK